MSFGRYAVVHPLSLMDLFTLDFLRQSKTNKETGFTLTRARLKTAQGTASTEGLNTQPVHSDDQFWSIPKPATNHKFHRFGTSIAIPVSNNPSENKTPPPENNNPLRK